jgi:hypothetical protein
MINGQMSAYVVAAEGKADIEGQIRNAENYPKPT